MQSQQPWYNLSCQSPQPTVRLPSTTFDPFTGRFQTQLSDQLSDHLSNHLSDQLSDHLSDQPPLVASLCSDFAFRSGSCLQIRGAAARLACIDACVLPVIGVMVGLHVGKLAHVRCDNDFAALKSMLLPVHYSILCSHCYSHSRFISLQICIWVLFQSAMEQTRSCSICFLCDSDVFALCCAVLFHCDSAAEYRHLFSAGNVAPGASASVEIFTADLLIPEPGLHVSFTYKPPAQPTPTHLELWCWMEPSNTATASASAASSSHNQGASAMLLLLHLLELLLMLSCLLT